MADETKLNWLVVNLTQGIFDGHYSSREKATASAELWAERWPRDTILVAKIEKRVSGYSGIPDDRFMARVIRAGE